jgi:hypothetical protein
MKKKSYKTFIRQYRNKSLLLGVIKEKQDLKNINHKKNITNFDMKVSIFSPSKDAIE